MVNRPRSIVVRASVFVAHCAFGADGIGDCSAIRCSGGNCTSLIKGAAFDCATALEPPEATTTSKGEFEGADFWEEHDALFRLAWTEAPRRNEDLYVWGEAFEQRYVHPELRAAVAAARGGQGEAKLWRLFRQLDEAPGVVASNALFTQAFLEDMQQELSHIDTLGIPTRRPNGMNRYGLMLDDVGFQSMFNGFVEKYIRPLAAMLFPELVTMGDADEHYAFTVRYAPGEDTELAKHGDASVATLNICLGNEFEGGALRFFGDGRMTGLGLVGQLTNDDRRRDESMEANVSFEPGLALFHRGQHKHQALELTKGERTNLVIWLFAEYGVVRVAPYPADKRLTARQRWEL